ncbi:hypothetical protein J6590_047456 [Homalodisca vitripennis]|nr:hypothetical protein J6590_047456 [Homalodisca vitripennis]
MGFLFVCTFLGLINLSVCILDPCYYYQDATTFDLTHPFYEGIPAYPGLDPQAFDLNLAYEYGDPHFFLSYNYSVSGLAGTSMTSPAVFYPFNRQISEIPFSQLVRLIAVSYCSLVPVFDVASMGYWCALIFLALISLSQCTLDPCFYNCEERSFDLTHPVYEGIPAYPGLYYLAYDQSLAFEFPEPGFLLTFNYTISGLGGTSITAPASFFPNSREIHEIPFTQLTRVEDHPMPDQPMEHWV